MFLCVLVFFCYCYRYLWRQSIIGTIRDIVERNLSLHFDSLLPILVFALKCAKVENHRFEVRICIENQKNYSKCSSSVFFSSVRHSEIRKCLLITEIKFCSNCWSQQTHWLEFRSTVFSRFSTWSSTFYGIFSVIFVIH